MPTREINWDRSMSVGVRQIDDQHRRLLEMCSSLSQAMIESRGQDELVKLMHNLVNYSLEHFTTEEKLMEQISYPELEQHRSKHQEFKTRILEFNDEHKKGNVFLTSQVLAFLRDWIINHILDEDFRCKPHYEKAGLT